MNLTLKRIIYKILGVFDFNYRIELSKIF